MSNSYDWENNKKIYKKVDPWAFGKRSVIECYWKFCLVLLKVLNSEFWILWKTLSLDYRPEGKIIISNLRTYTAYWYKAKKNWWRYFD